MVAGPEGPGAETKCLGENKSLMKTYIVIEHYSVIRKNEIMSFAATWMDLEMIILSEVSQKEKDKYHMISLICGL